MRAMVLLMMILSVISTASAATESSKILRAAEAGDSKALDRAFALHQRVDGGDAEDVDCAIGKSIRRHPKDFLIALKRNRAKVSRLDSVLGGLGDEYVDDLPKQRAELERRLSAIHSIRENALREVRVECEAELRRHLARLPN